MLAHIQFNLHARLRALTLKNYNLLAHIHMRHQRFAAPTFQVLLKHEYSKYTKNVVFKICLKCYSNKLIHSAVSVTALVIEI